MSYCLPKAKVAEFKRALRSGEIDPQKLADMANSEARRNYLAKFVGEADAIKVNALFESKLLLKNQKAGMIAWAKKVAGMSPEIKRDIITKIDNLKEVLNPVSEKAFLQDLASTRLGITITKAEGEAISSFTQKIGELKAKANEQGVFPTLNDRLQYGINKVALENYLNDIKLSANKLSLRKEPLKVLGKFIADVPGIMKSTVASFDNSLWGRQGIKTLYTNPMIWTKNFLKSWKDIVKQTFARGNILGSGDDAVMNSIKADIYSRPNAVLGKYKAGGYGLDVMSEEAYPSALPEKIPALGRLFKASEVAYNGGALRLRADLADRFIKMAEKNGVDTLNPSEAQPIGNLIGSLTGRGSLGKANVIGKEINTFAFSIKFLKANIDTLTGGLTDAKVRANPFARKQAGKALLRIVGTVASILTVAKLLDPNSVEEDPRSSNFGKIKMWGMWTDITGGMASLVTLASRLVPTMNNGEWGLWTKKADGTYRNLLGGEYGQQTALDVFDSFWQGKLSPVAGIVRDLWAGKDYSGNPVTLQSTVGNEMPLSIQNWNQLKNNPNASFPLGSTILDGLGLSVSQTIQPNSKTKIFPEGKSINNQDFLQTIATYAEAFGTDPETAFNRMFTGQRIRKVTNGTIIVERIPLNESEAIKKKANANNPLMKLDHTIPLELGGSNDVSNLKVVSTSEWSSYTKVENALGTALKAGKIDKNEAQAYILQFKKIQDSATRKSFGENLIKKIDKLPAKKTSMNLNDMNPFSPKEAMASESAPKSVPFTPSQRKEWENLNDQANRMEDALKVRSKSNLISPVSEESVRMKISQMRIKQGNLVRQAQREQGRKLTLYEDKTVDTFDQYQIPRAVIYGMAQAEGGTIGNHNVLNVGAYDSNPHGAINYKTLEESATASAKLLSGTFRKTNGQIDSKYKEAWENRGDPVKMLKMIEQAGFAGDPATWKERSAKAGGAGKTYDSWSEFIMDTPQWKKWIDKKG